MKLLVLTPLDLILLKLNKKKPTKERKTKERKKVEEVKSRRPTYHGSIYGVKTADHISISKQKDVACYTSSYPP